MNAPAKVLRDEIRAGRHTTVTTGLAPGHVQANLVILPADWAREFAEFCAANWRRGVLAQIRTHWTAGLQARIHEP